MSSKYFPNNWKRVKDIPDDLFEPTDYEVIVENLVTAWTLNSSIDTIIRATDLETKKVKEYVYKRAHNARQKLFKLCSEGRHEIIVMRAEEMYLISETPF